MRTGSWASTRLTAVRWLLLGLAVGYILLSLVLRAPSPRHAELLVVTAGLAILAIVLDSAVGIVIGRVGPLGGAPPDAGFLPGFWQFIVLAAGCGLIAYGAIDRVHGAAWLGLANLVGFVVAASTGAEATLLGWPLVLLAGGAAVIAAGLRPRVPLPPEPTAYAVERPLASRADEEVIFRVRNDDPPEPRPSTSTRWPAGAVTNARGAPQCPLRGLTGWPAACRRCERRLVVVHDHRRVARRWHHRTSGEEQMNLCACSLRPTR